jgi:ketosteroid isomerase-like protein
VELAAARTSVLSPAKILERLSQQLDLLEGGRDADPRQRTLRTTIAWSFDLLSDTEQDLFAHLAVFAGGCTLEAAEEVAGADLGTLRSLVEKSLVRFTHDRYWMLETIRGFAVERLEASGEADDLRRRHAAWFLALAEEAEPHLRKESLEWLDRLEPEHDNVRAALDHLGASGADDLALRLVAAFWWFWSLRGHIAEGRHRVEGALAHDQRPTIARAMASTGAADLAGDDDDEVASEAFGREALALGRTLDDRWIVALNLLGLGVNAAAREDFASARPLFEESTRLFREDGDDHWERQAARRLAWSLESLGDSDGARALHEDLVRRARAAGDDFGLARSLAVLAQYELEAGRVDDEVVSMLVDAHDLHRTRSTLPDRYSDAIILSRFAFALALKDRPEAAIELLSCFEARCEESPFRVTEPWVVRLNDDTIALVEDRMDEGPIARARAAGRALTADEAVELATRGLRAALAAD